MSTIAADTIWVGMNEDFQRQYIDGRSLLSSFIVGREIPTSFDAARDAAENNVRRYIALTPIVAKSQRAGSAI